MVNIKNSQINLKPKEKIIKYLIENKNSHSIRETSGAIFLDYKNTYNLVSDLSEIISKEKLGNTSIIKLNLIPNQEIFSTENKRTEEFLIKHPKIRIVKNYIKELNYPFLIALIFGSYAKNKESKSSDIDLCIISDNENKTRELLEKLNLLSLKLEIHEFTSKEFISMIEKKQNNVGLEIIKNNIILYGIENYYNLISKWMKNE